MRQRLELSEAEHDTRIRAKYLGALEEERFDVLSGPAYTKGFLRTYADYLGLDAQRFVDDVETLQEFATLVLIVHMSKSKQGTGRSRHPPHALQHPHELRVLQAEPDAHEPYL